jgi:hypothetical protein
MDGANTTEDLENKIELKNDLKSRQLRENSSITKKDSDRTQYV